jgi:hypothetical protein
MSDFPESIVLDIHRIVREWEPKLLALPRDVIETRRNSQNRTIRQILGHLIDSASNNTHRTVHLQYRESPVEFPNYATFGNNDHWIAIQDYQTEDWHQMVALWKYSNLHLAHVYSRVDQGKLSAEWIAGPGKRITLREMTGEYVPHLKLHLDEITGLLSAG